MSICADKFANRQWAMGNTQYKKLTRLQDNIQFFPFNLVSQK